MSMTLIGLAILMGAATYPWRALPLLAPGVDRLPPLALAYLRLVGPAVLAALAVVNTIVATGPGGQPTLRIGIALPAVVLCVAIVARRRNLFVGLAAGVALAAVSRAVGIA